MVVLLGLADSRYTKIETRAKLIPNFSCVQNQGSAYLMPEVMLSKHRRTFSWNSKFALQLPCKKNKHLLFLPISLFLETTITIVICLNV